VKDFQYGSFDLEFDLNLSNDNKQALGHMGYRGWVMATKCDPHRHRLQGGDEGDRPQGPKVVASMPPSRLHRNFVTCKRYSKNYECVIIKLKKVRRFQPKMHQNRLAAGLRPDPLWELTALPQTS